MANIKDHSVSDSKDKSKIKLNIYIVNTGKIRVEVVQKILELCIQNELQVVLIAGIEGVKVRNLIHDVVIAVNSLVVVVKNDHKVDIDPERAVLVRHFVYLKVIDADLNVV